MTYAEKLKDPRWQKKRLKILERDNWMCKKCKDTTTTLHVHHLKYEKKKNPWDYPMKDLVALCEECHKAVEELKKEMFVFEFKCFKSFKSTGWTDSSKIYFYHYFDEISKKTVMEIYEDNEKVIGYKLYNNLIYDLIKFLKPILKDHVEAF